MDKQLESHTVEELKQSELDIKFINDEDVHNNVQLFHQTYICQRQQNNEQLQQLMIELEINDNSQLIDDMQSAQQDYQKAVLRKQPQSTETCEEKLNKLKRGLGLIILINQSDYFIIQQVILKNQEEMQKQMDKLELKNEDQIVEQIQDEEQALQKYRVNQINAKKVTQKKIEQLYALEQLSTEIKALQQKQEELKKLIQKYTERQELNSLLDDFEIFVSDIIQSIEEKKALIQKKEKSGQQKEAEIERNKLQILLKMDELAEKLQLYTNIQNQYPDSKEVQNIQQDLKFPQLNSNIQGQQQMLNEQQLFIKINLQDKLDQIKENPQVLNGYEDLVRTIELNYDSIKSNQNSTQKSLFTSLHNLIQKLSHSVDFDEKLIMKSFKELEERVKIEAIQGITKNLDIVKSQLVHSNYFQAFKKLSKLLFNQKVIIFKFYEFLHLVELTKHTNNIIQKKDIVLLLGITGSGKSTLLQYLAGSKMQEFNVNGIIHIDVAKFQNEELRKVKISCHQKSETRYLTPITVDLHDIGSSINREIILVDSPGSEDQESAEVDLANQLGILKAIKKAKSVRIILCFSYLNIGAKFQIFKEQLKQYYGIINQIQENCAGITYVFSKVPNNDVQNIQRLIEDCKKNMNTQEKSDKKLNVFLDDVIKKGKEDLNIAINPLDKNPLIVFDKILKTRQIENPSQAFNFGISQKTQQQFDAEFQLNHKQIMRAFTNQEYKLAYQQILLLQKISLILKNQSTYKKFQLILQDVQIHFNKMDEEITSFINRHCMNDSIFQQSEIDKIKEILASINQLGDIRIKFLTEKENQNDRSALVRGIDDYNFQIKQLCNKLCGALEQQDIDFQHVDKIFAKVQILSKNFFECTSKFDEILERYKVQLNQFTDESIYNISKEIEDFIINEQNLQNKEADSEIYKKLISARSIIKFPECAQTIALALKSIEEHIFNSLNQSFQRFDALLQQNNQKINLGLMEKITDIKKQIIINKIFKGAYCQCNINLTQQFKTLEETIATKLIKCYNVSLDTFQKELLNSEKDFRLLRDAFKQLEEMSQIQLIKDRMSNEFIELKVNIIIQMDISKKAIDQILQNIKDNHTTENIENHIEQLKKSLKIVLLHEKILGKSNIEFREEIIESINDWKVKIIKETPIKHYKLLGIEQFKQLLKSYELILQVDECFQVLKIKDNNNQNRLKESINETFIYIDEHIIKFQLKIEQNSLSKSQFDQLYLFYQTSQAAEKFKFNISTEDKNIDQKTLFNQIVELASKQGALLKQEIQSHIKKLQNYSLSVKFLDEQDYREKCDEFMYEVLQINQKILLIKNIEINKEELFIIIEIETDDIKDFWVNKLSKVYDTLIEKIGQTQNMNNLQIYKVYGESLLLSDNKLEQKIQKLQQKLSQLQIKEEQNSETSNYVIIIEEELRKQQPDVQFIQNQIHKLIANELELKIQIDSQRIESLLINNVISISNQIVISDIESFIEQRNIKFLEVLIEMQKIINNKQFGDFSYKIAKVLEQLGGQTYKFQCNNIAKAEKLISHEQFDEVNKVLYSNQQLIDILQRLQSLEYDKAQEKQQALINKIIEKIDYVNEEIQKLEVKENLIISTTTQRQHYLLDSDFEIQELRYKFDLIRQSYQELIKKLLDNFETKVPNSDNQNLDVKVINDLFLLLPKSYTQQFEKQKVIIVEKFVQQYQEKSEEIKLTFEINNFKKLKEISHDCSKKQKIQIKEEFSLYLKKQFQHAEDYLQQQKIGEATQYLALGIQSLNEIGYSLDDFQAQKIQFEKVIKDFILKIQKSIIEIKNYTKSVYYQKQAINMEKHIVLVAEFYEQNEKEIKVEIFQEQFNSTLNKIEKQLNEIQKAVIYLKNNINQHFKQIDSNVEKYIQAVDQYLNFYPFLLQVKKSNLATKMNHQNLKEEISQIDLDKKQFESTVKQLVENILIEAQNIQIYEKQLRTKNERTNHIIKIIKIKDKLDFLKTKKLQIEGLNDGINIADQTFQEQINQQVKQLIDQSSYLANPNILVGNKDAQKGLNSYYLHLKSLNQNFKLQMDVRIKIQQSYSTIDSQILNIISNFQTEILDNKQQYDKLSDGLMKLQEFSQNLSSFDNIVQEKISQIFVQLQQDKSQNFKKVLKKLYQHLFNNPIGLSIIKDQPCFLNYQRKMFNQKIKTQDIEYVLENLKSSRDDIEISQLRENYDDFNKHYKDLINEYLVMSTINLDPLAQNIRTTITDSQNRGEKEIIKNIPNIVAKIFAYWSLINSDAFINPDSQSNNQEDNDFLLQPHPAQVISIFRSLGIGYKQQQMRLFNLISYSKNDDSQRNNLIEIKTGEGKSIILGVLSIIFALLGYNLNCACYSKYLSSRDYHSFFSMFDKLGTIEKTFYGTFNEVCEKMINNKGPIRDLVFNEILKDQEKPKQQLLKHIDNPEVLLIDEVDVFLDSDFYGALYPLEASIKNQTITNLILYLWQNKKDISIKQIFNSNEYKCCQAIFKPQYTSLLDECLKDMIYDLKVIHEHTKYKCKDGKIGYKEQDQINYQISYGYKTMWAYCQEYENQNVTLETRNRQLCLGINCGSFSYAQIAKQFPIILGVSGTLQTLTKIEKEILQSYNINTQTFIPTVYGAMNLKFKEIGDVLISKQDSYYLDIVSRIDLNIRGKDYQRAVIVIFEDEEKVNKFYGCNEFSQIKNSKDIIKITEQLSDSEKCQSIKDATLAGGVSLITKSFGRGTDFISLDRELNQNGGIHVILTFFPSSLSEEVQMKGRTARQGNEGSFQMILLDSDLTKFDLSIEEIEVLRQKNNCYFKLNEKRNSLLELNQNEEIKANEEINKTCHIQAQQLKESLLSQNSNKIRELLQTINQGKSTFETVRTLILLDATGSMSLLITKLKFKIQEMFLRAQEILSEQKLDGKIFEIQIAAYRNYNAPENEILENSEWESKPEQLRKFLETINAVYGWTNEAIEIGFWFAGQQIDQISQIFLIGDAPPNTEEEIQCKRAQSNFKKDYQSETKYGKVKPFEEEMKILIEKDIPIHTFYLHERAEQEFSKIAKLTKGESKYLDVNAADGGNVLRDTFTEKILQCIGCQNGGQGQGDHLVQAYRKRYKVNE